MSSWHAQVRAALFAAWDDAGLPDPARGLRPYREAIARAPAPIDVPPDTEGPLNRELVDRVHGFGVAIGRALADMLALPDGASTDAAVAWCGRFNLSISLLDYVCDESGRVDALEGLEPFRTLSGRSAPPPTTATLEERVVSELAVALLTELDASPARPAEWLPLVRDLYAAEVITARESYTTARSTDEVRALLRTKSAGPFALMATRLSAGADDAARESASALGAAVGALFWLADDAADLWLDLSRGAWNMFLVDVAAHDATLLGAPASPFRDAAVVRLLGRHDVAARSAREVGDELVAALARVPAQSGQQDGLAVVAAALSVW